MSNFRQGELIAGLYISCLVGMDMLCDKTLVGFSYWYLLVHISQIAVRLF